MLWFGLLGLPFFLLAIVTIIQGGISNTELIPEEWTVIYTVAFSFLFLVFHFLSLGIIAELAMNTGDFVPFLSLVRTVPRKEN
jgi:hypothetical protein